MMAWAPRSISRPAAAGNSWPGLRPALIERIAGITSVSCDARSGVTSSIPASASQVSYSFARTVPVVASRPTVRTRGFRVSRCRLVRSIMWTTGTPTWLVTTGRNACAVLHGTAMKSAPAPASTRAPWTSHGVGTVPPSRRAWVRSGVVGSDQITTRRWSWSVAAGVARTSLA